MTFFLEQVGAPTVPSSVIECQFLLLVMSIHVNSCKSCQFMEFMSIQVNSGHGLHVQVENEKKIFFCPNFENLYSEFNFKSNGGGSS